MENFHVETHAPNYRKYEQADFTSLEEAKAELARHTARGRFGGVWHQGEDAAGCKWSKIVVDCCEP